MSDTHSDDPLLQAIGLSDDELAVLWAMRDGGGAGGAGAESLRTRGILDDDGFVDPYSIALGPLIAPELVASAHRRTRIDDERRVYFVSGGGGVVLGAWPTGGWYATAFDRAHLPELVVRFLGLKAWPGARGTDAFRVAPEGDLAPVALLGLLLHLGSYAFVSARVNGSDERLGWVDGGGGALWSLDPALDPANEDEATGAGGTTLRAIRGVDLVEKVASALPVWGSEHA